MTLSKLVHYLNHLQQFDIGLIRTTAFRPLAAMMAAINTDLVQFDMGVQSVQHSWATVDQSLDALEQALEDLKQQVRDSINRLEPQYFTASQNLFDNEMCNDPVPYVLSRRMKCDPDSAQLLQGRIYRYTDWRVPGMIVGPGLESHIEHMVPMDPLYLIDTNLELLMPACNGFTEAYRRRLRLYSVNEYHDDPILQRLPDQQFGFCLAYNYFNYRPLSVICRWLEELWIKLRPGGAVLFTYNDCDRAHGVALAERSFMCYTPGSRIRSHAQHIGFEISHNHTGQADLCWIELIKPGYQESLRGGQTLAEIVANS